MKGGKATNLAMRKIVRNFVGMILVASACLMFAIEIDADWYYSWLAPATFAIVAYFAFIGNPFLKLLLLCVAVCVGLLLVLYFVLVNQHDSGIEFFIFAIPVLMAKSSVFLILLLFVEAFWPRPRRDDRD